MPTAISVPARFRWLPVLGWVLGVVVLATGGWSVRRAYDYRAAVREARAAGFDYRESPTPFAAIRADWHAAFCLATWLEHERRLDLPEGTDLAPLRPLLLRLDPTGLRAWQCRNVDALRGLTRLRTLSLTDSEVKDLTPLADLAQLQGLYLFGCTGVADLAPLASLTQLQVIDLRYCNAVADLAPLASLTKLQQLDLGGCTGVTDLAPLTGLTQLQRLHLGGCTGVADLAPLAGLAQLHTLSLFACTGVADLAPLASLAQLGELDLTDCTGVSDLTPLAGLTRLHGLILEGCTGVADLAPLAGLAHLQWLNLAGCTGLSAEMVAAFRAKHPTANLSGP
ncbi:MAG: hypothetical protein K8R23_10290 [Chthoniobacter sp.]|nr:hypothetical protein [Chthoniobacter sp.]